jgi:hypothetical protein
MKTLLQLDLANGSGQSSLGSTHVGLGQMGSGQKTGRPKWVAQPMTLTWSFKGRVKTGLTRIFTHEKIYIKKNENKLDPIVQNFHLVFFVFLSIQIREHINKNTHK